MIRHRQRRTALRYEADVLGIPYRDLLASLRSAGALSRDPNGGGYTVRRGWSDKFRDRRFYRAIELEGGGLFHREISVVYCTRKGQHWLAEFVAERQVAAPTDNQGARRDAV